MDPNQPQQQVAQANNSASPTPQQVVPQNGGGRKKIIIISIVIFFFLILLILTGAFFVQNSREDSALVATTPTQAPSPTEVIPDTSYENIRLPLNQPTQVANSDIELTYQGKEEAECPDCYSSTKVKLVAGGEEVVIDYYCGGIAGDCSVVERVLGYEVELIENFDPNQVVVTIREI